MDVTKIREILDYCAPDANSEGEPQGQFVLVDVWDAVPLRASKVFEFASEMSDQLRPILDLLKQRVSDGEGHMVPASIDLESATTLLGDESVAIKVFAYGSVAHWWSVVAPHISLGIAREGSLADNPGMASLILAMGFPD